MQERIEKFTKKYGPYLEEIRRKIITFSYFFIFSFLASFALMGSLVKFAFERFGENDIRIFVESPFQFFTVAFHLALFIAIFLTFPLAVYFIYSFFRAALKRKERIVMIRLAIMSILLFMSGFIFGVGIMYHAMIYLAGFNAKIGLANIWNMGVIISQILLASVLLGVYFQYPLILTILIRLGLITVDLLREKRRIMILATVAIVSILPPPETIATIVMLVPLLAMYEITILANKKYRRIDGVVRGN